MSLGTGLALIAICLILQGLFSGSEMALVSADRLKLETQRQDGNAGAALALALLSEEERLLGTCLIGTNVCVISGTTAVSALLASRGYEQEWLVALCYVPVALVLGEALPKMVYQHHATMLAPHVARFVAFVQVLLAPPLFVVSAWGRALARLTGQSGRAALTREEIVTLLNDQEPGIINAEEHKLIQRVFELTETAAEEAMTPLVDVDALPADATIRDAVEVAVRHGHTRIPVYEERVDHIIGVLQTQDLLFAPDVPTIRLDDPVRPLLRPVKYVPESKRVDELLHEMRRQREHFAVLVDEYGGSVGIVTIEDLLEEIIGEIQDEHDLDAQRIRRINENEWRVPARVEIDKLEAVVGKKLPDGDYETVAGLLLARIGRIPRKGEVLKVDDLVFRVEEANERAIQMIHVTVTRPTPK